MTRPTPVCHLTIGPDTALLVYVHPDDGHRDYVPDTPAPRACIGSACSAWEQVTIADEGPGLMRCGLVKSSAVTSGAWRDPAQEQKP